MKYYKLVACKQYKCISSSPGGWKGVKEVSSELESGSQGRFLAHSVFRRLKMEAPVSSELGHFPKARPPNTINRLPDLVMAQTPQMILGLPPGVRLTSPRRG